MYISILLLQRPLVKCSLNLREVNEQVALELKALGVSSNVRSDESFVTNDARECGLSNGHIA